MISKEKLLNGYIENDKGKLRKLWVSTATYHDFDVTWVNESMCFDNLSDALDDKYCFLTECAVDSADSETYIKCKNKLIMEDFVEYRTPNRETKSALVEVKNCTFTSSDIFQQMLTLAEQNSMSIQFDGFDNIHNSDKVVITKQGSDTEYVVANKQEFDQLVEGFSVLEKFERK